MRHSAFLLVALLAATPLCRASLNTLAANELPRAMLAQTCNVLNAPQADWGDINAVVRSARACLPQKAVQERTKRSFVPVAEPQWGDDAALWQGISVTRSSR